MKTLVTQTLVTQTLVIAACFATNVNVNDAKWVDADTPLVRKAIA